MRIHPPTGFILERVVPDGGVTLGGTYLPKGTIVGVNSWVIHYNKQVFGDDVDVFRPERWLEDDQEDIANRHRNMFAVSNVRFLLPLATERVLTEILSALSLVPGPVFVLESTSVYWRCGRLLQNSSGTLISSWRIPERSGIYKQVGL